MTIRWLRCVLCGRPEDEATPSFSTYLHGVESRCTECGCPECGKSQGADLVDRAEVASELEDFDRLKELILEHLPYDFANGPSPEECIEFAGKKIAALRAENATLRRWQVHAELHEERDEALRLLATRVEAKRLDEAQEEIAALREACTLALGIMEQKNRVTVLPTAKFVDVKFAPEDVAVLRAALEPQAPSPRKRLEDYRLRETEKGLTLVLDAEMIDFPEDTPPTCDFCDKLRCACTRGATKEKP